MSSSAIRCALLTMFMSIGTALFVCPASAFARLAGVVGYLDKPDDWFHSAEADLVLRGILSWQKPNGGWWKQYDPSTIRSPQEQAADDRPAIFDNDATISEMRILARAHRVTGKASYRDAFDRAMTMTLSAQYPNGGWPQEYPPPHKGYAMHVTFNDDAMMHVLNLMRDVGDSRSPDFAFVDESVKARARDAFQRGVRCVLDAQIRVDGKPTVWCAQHDRHTLAPAKARAYELPSFSGGESRGLVLLLMSIDEPSQEVKDAVIGAAQWYEDHKIVGVREERVRDDRSPKGYDVRHIADPDAEPRWARFYDLETGKPFFCGRDGVKRERLADIELERRSGYAWLRPWGKQVLERYPAWARTHGAPPLTPSQGITLPL